MSPLGSSSTGSGLEQIHHMAAVGEVYYVRLSGSNNDVRLRICNLVNHTGTTVTVSDTAASDLFVFAPAENSPAPGTS